MSLSFPSFFAITKLKEAWVRKCNSEAEKGEGCQPLLTKRFNDWELRMWSGY